LSLKQGGGWCAIIVKQNNKKMKISNKLEELKSKTAVLLFLDLLFLVLPGVLAIFLYKNDLYLQLD